MRRVPHSWREAYELALMESDPIKVIGRIEYAMYALERRYSEWTRDPGTPAELAAIEKCISALARLMKQNRLATDEAHRSTSAGKSNGTEQKMTENRGQGTDYSSGVGVA
jgi:hypothetical protein